MGGPGAVSKNTRRKKEELSQKNENIFDFDEEKSLDQNIWKFMNKIHDSQIYISKQNDEIMEKLRIITEENINLKKKQEENKAIIKNMSTEIDELKCKIGEIEQKDLRKKLNFVGLPSLNIEEQPKIINDILKEMNINITNEDIKNISKYENKTTKTTDYTIELKNENLKTLILNKRKEKRIFINSKKQIISEDLNQTINGSNQDKKPIYINEHLSKFHFDLLKHAKSLKQHGYNYVWYKFEKIYVRKTGNSKIINIRSMKTIDNLINQINN